MVINFQKKSFFLHYLLVFLCCWCFLLCYISAVFYVAVILLLLSTQLFLFNIQIQNSARREDCSFYQLMMKVCCCSTFQKRAKHKKHLRFVWIISQPASEEKLIICLFQHVWLEGRENEWDVKVESLNHKFLTFYLSSNEGISLVFLFFVHLISTLYI